MSNILIIGATSSIAHSVAKKYASEQCTIYLVARSEHKLNAVASDIAVRGAQAVYTDICDFTNPKEQNELFKRVLEKMPVINVVLIAHGSLPDQEICEESPDYAMEQVYVNFTSVVGLSMYAAEILKKQKKGTIAIIGSVAGERGRQSNYIYGAAKAGVTAFCSGLRNRLLQYNVHVITILPGFVDTPMTAHLPKNFLFASADDVGNAIVHGIKKQKDILFVPFFWRIIMTIVKLVPEFIFKKLKT